jgi:hypothetical protein
LTPKSLYRRAWATHNFAVLIFEKSATMKLYSEESIDHRDKLVVEASEPGLGQSKIAAKYRPQFNPDE